MMTSSRDTISTTHLPMIDEQEVNMLVRCYGQPLRRAYTLEADDYMRFYRWRRDPDRRAEVVFAILRPDDLIWLHTKSHYPAHIYRLLSGGVGLDEAVGDALWREVAEETGLPCVVEAFLGLLTYQFRYQGETADFASYIFALRTDFTEPVCERDDEVSGFRAVLPGQLLDVSNELRNMLGDRHCWGHWRALAADLVYEQLSGGDRRGA
jgi:8-oxo-dGTP pyrophosphatase MutT (NUDIX family)